MIRIVIVDDHPIVLAGVVALFKQSKEVEVVAQAETAAEALRAVAEYRPDILITDISLPDMSGFDLTRLVRDKYPEMKQIVLTVHESEAYAHPLLAAGVDGYVLKRSAADRLLSAISSVLAGERYLDPMIARRASKESVPAPSETGDVSLSAREREVLSLVARGFSSKEIASRSSMSIKSVETYKARATTKLGLRSRAEIVHYVMARGWLAPLAD